MVPFPARAVRPSPFLEMSTPLTPFPEYDRRGWLERQVFALTRECPVDHGNPTFCPLHGLRPEGEDFRRRWIHGLSDAELEYLARYHSCCLHVRTSPPPPA
jgi:hypothetical protein